MFTKKNRRVLDPLRGPCVVYFDQLVETFFSALFQPFCSFQSFFRLTKNFDQLLGAGSTQKLVEIHNTLERCPLFSKIFASILCTMGGTAPKLWSEYTTCLPINNFFFVFIWLGRAKLRFQGFLKLGSTANLLVLLCYMTAYK